MDVIFKLAKTEKDFKQIYKLRYKTFVEAEGYNPSAIEIERGGDAAHLIALRKDKIVGAITLIVDNGQGLPMEKYFNLTVFKNDEKVAEVGRFAILPDEQTKIVPVGLIALAYEVAQKRGIKQIFIDFFKSEEKIRFYERLGFKVIGNYFWKNEIVVMTVTLYDSPYAKDEEKIELREFFVRSLPKSAELEELLA